LRNCLLDSFELLLSLLLTRESFLQVLPRFPLCLSFHFAYSFSCLSFSAFHSSTCLLFHSCTFILLFAHTLNLSSLRTFTLSPVALLTLAGYITGPTSPCTSPKLDKSATKLLSSLRHGQPIMEWLVGAVEEGPRLEYEGLGRKTIGQNHWVVQVQPGYATQPYFLLSLVSHLILLHSNLSLPRMHVCTRLL